MEVIVHTDLVVSFLTRNFALTCILLMWVWEPNG